MTTLSDRLSTPPAPNPSALQDMPDTGMPPMPQGAPSALAGPGGGGAPAAPGQPPPQMPAPNHAHTVAALRHFAALAKQLEGALKDPDLGKSDIKSKVIDGMTELVQERMIPPGEAVATLATFPERPFEQKQWVTQHYQQVMQARNFVLAHHAMAFAGEGPAPTPGADTHMQDVSGMMAQHYGGARA
jgi:hypothetical protein